MRKTDPAQFGGGRPLWRRPYTVDGITRLLCSYVGCDRSAYATWGACADGNIQRPMCPEHDYACNVAALWMSGDPEADDKLDRYAVDLEVETGRKLDLDIVVVALKRIQLRTPQKG